MHILPGAVGSAVNVVQAPGNLKVESIKVIPRLFHAEPNDIERELICSGDASWYHVPLTII